MYLSGSIFPQGDNTVVVEELTDGIPLENAREDIQVVRVNDIPVAVIKETNETGRDDINVDNTETPVLKNETTEGGRLSEGCRRIRVRFYIDCANYADKHSTANVSTTEKSTDTPSHESNVKTVENKDGEETDDEDEEDEEEVEDVNEGGNAQIGGARNVANLGRYGFGGVLGNATGYHPYTPLQKWEYLRGYPVDGVTDVQKWAIEVGLAEIDDDESPKAKKLKSNPVIEPPKYEGCTFRIPLSSAAEENQPDETEMESDAADDEDPVRKSKGKKKM